MIVGFFPAVFAVVLNVIWRRYGAWSLIAHDAVHFGFAPNISDSC
ncbi:MAG: hypothetical protein R2682_14060 [Pyrinomonadaceae bacterium]